MFRLLALSCLLLWSSLSPGPAEAASDSASFMQAVRATKIGASTTDAMSLVALLREMGKAEQAEALQRELLYLYLESVGGKPHDLLLTIGQAIDAGTKRHNEPDAAAWQRVYDNIAFEWQGVTTQLPPGLQSLADRAANGELVRAGPGLWATTAPRPRMYLNLRLRNNSLQAVPFHEASLELPGEPALPSLLCRIDTLAGTKQRVERRVIPDGTTKDVICETDGDPSLREALPARVAEARLGKLKPVLWPTEAETASGRARLATWLLDGKPVPRNWSDAWKKAQNDPQKKWMAGSRAMAEPALRPTLRQKWAKRSDGLVAALQITGATLALFVIGRVLRRMGWPRVAVAFAGAAVVLGITVLSFISIVGPNPTSGDGWNRPVVGGLVVLFYLGFIVMGLAALTVLHRVLDEEGISWVETVASGWRQAVQWHGTATRGEFWGFAVHGAWLWFIARFCLPPFEWLVFAALLFPMTTLMVRRWRSLTTIDIIGMTMVLAMVALELVPDR